MKKKQTYDERAIDNRVKRGKNRLKRNAIREREMIMEWNLFKKNTYTTYNSNAYTQSEYTFSSFFFHSSHTI